jgi:UDP-N-acetylglucosamine--N-acetylmuramyl-(pentapeptide) pyrophosphoryl-undecaprenol N-acetylglucosamine transferase
MNNISNNFYLILAGGTGGHISPGVALAEVLQRENSNGILLSSKRNIDNPDLIYLKKNFLVEFFNPPGIPKNIFQIFPFLIKTLVSLLFICKLCKKYGINSIIGMGGYTSFPGLLYGILTRKKIFLCEQNCVPGLITRLFRRRAASIFLSYPLTRFGAKFYKVKCFETGNPLREKIRFINANNISNPEKGALGEENDFSKRKTPWGKVNRDDRKPVILSMGGSQGAEQINELIYQLVRQKPNLCKNFNFIMLSGETTYEKYKNNMKGFSNINLMKYEVNIQNLFRKTDLLVSRSGAGLLAEASYFGIPMILIPYPFAADNHQKDNAEYAKKMGAAEILDGKFIEPVQLLNKINSMLDKKRYFKYQIGCLKMSRPNAANIIIHKILESDRTYLLPG